MKDNKNMVFALNSYTVKLDITRSTHDYAYSTTSYKEFEPCGFLLFPDEEKADIFLQLCENMNKVNKQSDYTKYGYIEVTDNLADRVEQNRQFYIGGLTNNLKEKATTE